MKSNIQRGLALFRALDRDGDFRLSVGDLERTLGCYHRVEAVASPEPFASLSSVPDGTLDFVEFLDFLREAGMFSVLSNRSLILRLIMQMTGGDPSVGIGDLAARMRNAGYGVSERDLETVFSLLLGEPRNEVDADDVLSLLLKTQG